MLTYRESIDNYYKLKAKYEEQINKIKQNLHNNLKLSIREKKKQFNEFRPKCISCQRPVGTIFSNRYNEEDDSRNLLSICGDRVNPCNLNINIDVGNYILLPDLVKMNEIDIENIKNSIILDKNKLLFGLIQTENAIENFDDYKNEINQITTLLEYYLDLYNNLVNNKEKNEELNKNIELLNIQIISIKKAIKDYNSTGDTQFIKDAVDIYINNLQLNKEKNNLINKIQELKYKQKYVEYDDVTGIYHLIQNKVGINNLEIDLKEPKVISFNIGGKEMIKKSKTKKSRDIFKEDKTKTKKIRTELIIEDEKEEDEVDKKINGEEQNIVKSQQNNFVLDSDNTVTWTNPIYQQIWNSLDEKYKNILIKDQNWMKLTMDNYVDKKNNKQPREFVLPQNLIVPPELLSENRYNLGNETINNIFNELSEIQKKSLLSMVSKDKKDMESNKMFLYSLGLVIGQKIGFSKY